MRIGIFTFVVLGLVVLGFWSTNSSAPSASLTDDTDSGRDDTGLDQTTCTEAGGAWNPCGSACRMDPDAICIELCVEYCECSSDVECPSGYVCGDDVDGVGVCLSS